MTQAKPRFSTFKDYLSYDDGTDNRCELVDGVLIELPPESGLNDAIANYLFLRIAATGINFLLIRPHTCELQVPLINPGDPYNRFPDLVVLREEHLILTQQRLTVTLDMLPPRLVVEVVSPGQKNRERDYQSKLAQYQAREIGEYWIVDPEMQIVTVLSLESIGYREIGKFRADDRIVSPTFSDSNLLLTARQVLSAGA